MTTREVEELGRGSGESGREGPALTEAGGEAPRAVPHRSALTVGGLLALQRAAGNAAVARLIDSGPPTAEEDAAPAHAGEPAAGGAQGDREDGAGGGGSGSNGAGGGQGGASGSPADAGAGGGGGPAGEDAQAGAGDGSAAGQAGGGGVGAGGGPSDGGGPAAAGGSAGAGAPAAADQAAGAGGGPAGGGGGGPSDGGGAGGGPAAAGGSAGAGAPAAAGQAAAAGSGSPEATAGPQPAEAAAPEAGSPAAPAPASATEGLGPSSGAQATAGQAVRGSAGAGAAAGAAGPAGAAGASALKDSVPEKGASVGDRLAGAGQGGAAAAGKGAGGEHGGPKHGAPPHSGSKPGGSKPGGPKADHAGHGKANGAGHGKGHEKAGAAHGGADRTGGAAGGTAGAAAARPGGPAGSGGATSPLPGPQPIPRKPVSQVAFAEPDVEKLLPPAGPEDAPEERRGKADGLRKELGADRERATAMVTAFVDSRRSQSDDLAAFKPAFETEMAQAHEVAAAGVESAVQSKVAEVQATVGSVLAALHGEAAAARAAIDGEHESTLGAIRAASLTAKASLIAGSVGTLAQAATAEATQLSTLGNLYTQVEGDFRSAAESAGALAVTKAAERAAAFRAGRINEDDSFLDGPLTDNRCDAQAEAAEKVGSGYHDELVKEGGKQADKLAEHKPTDEAAVRQLTGETRSNLATTLQHALQGIDDMEHQSIANANLASQQLHEHLDSTLQTLEQGLTEHEATQVAQLHSHAEEQKAALHKAAGEAMAAVGTALTTATSDIDAALEQVVAQLSHGDLPEPATLEQTLAQAGTQLDGRMNQLKDGLQTQGKQAVTTVGTTGTQAASALAQIGQAAVDSAQTTGSSGSTAISTVLAEGTRGLQQLATGHGQATQASVQGFTTASQALLAGQTAGYARVNENLTNGGRANVENVRKGLTDVVEQDMAGVIATEAQKARDQVQPRWKSVLKWIIIIAIVLVVAIVVGPMVIGAAAGLATALGTSAVVGTIVGGALVGAATSAVVTVVDNGFSGRALTTGLGRAIVLGAIGGGLGGAAAGLLSGPMQGMTTLARYGTQVAVDMTIDTGINAATGNLSWENFGTSLCMSMLVNGVSVHPRVQAFTEAGTSRGFGAGYDAGTGIRSQVTGAGGPGSLGAVGIDAPHVNVGDTAGPGSPYAGKWNMQGGGHNAGEFRGRIAGEGGAPADYRGRTVAEDPVTNVAIDEVTRNQLQNAPGGPRPVVDPATGAPATRSQAKSLFPPSMDRPAIQAAGQRALELSIGGAPGTEHTPPPGPGQNGQFSAIVTTPEGHPIRVRGYYSEDPVTGQRTIQTVYPDTDLPGRSIDPVPGSRTVVPGAATPPQYDSGDD